MPQNRLKNFKDNLLILFTGKTRSTSEILEKQSKILNSNNKKRQTMIEMVNLVKDFKYELIMVTLVIWENSQWKLDKKIKYYWFSIKFMDKWSLRDCQA